jgi:hypothetical protein
MINFFIQLDKTNWKYVSKYILWDRAQAKGLGLSSEHVIYPLEGSIPIYAEMYIICRKVCK